MIQLANILSARWLISGEVALNYLPLLVSFLNGQKITIDAAALGKTDNKPFAIAGNSDINATPSWYFDNPELPENSIGIIPIQGVLFDYDTRNISRYLTLAAENPNINSILLLVNSPGGMISQIDLVSDQIRDFPKPVISYVTDIAASAAMWLISGSLRIILSSKLNRVGSVGVMTNFTDIWPALKNFGVDKREIYATKSTHKNILKRTLTDPSLSKEEQEKPLIAELDFVNDYFHQVISKNRGIALESEVFTGADYYSEKGIESGLADEINSLDYALTLAHKLGLENKINLFTKNYQQ